MITERGIINFLILAASMALVPFVIYSTLLVDYAPVILFGGLVILALSFFYLKDKLCLYPLIVGGCGGTFDFIPIVPLGPTHVVCILLILYYITGYIAIKQQSIKLGNTKFLWPILIVAGIVLYHNHQFSLHVAGSSTEGAKPAILLLLVVLAYFCSINVRTPSVELLANVPLYYLIAILVSNIPYVFTTFFPSTAPYLLHVYSNVNAEAYFESQLGPSVDSGTGVRISAYAAIASALQVFLLSHYPIGTWLRPNRWWVACLSVICLYMAASNGYRNVMFGYLLFVFVGTWCYYSARALVLPLAVTLVCLCGVIVLNTGVFNVHVDRLPENVQRTLSFFPLDWDKEVIESAENSNGFRNGIQKVYIEEYLYKSPLVGNGFDIDTAEYDALRGNLDGGIGNSEYLQAKVFITAKAFHTGWISVYDIVGLIGSAAFVLLGWNEIWFVGKFIFGPRSNRKSLLFPLYVWVMCNVLVNMITFFTVFGDFANTFTNLVLYGMLLSHLYETQRTTEVPVPFSGPKGQVEFMGLKGALYGYRYRQ
jgi:hypothetical protein